MLPRPTHINVPDKGTNYKNHVDLFFLFLFFVLQICIFFLLIAFGNYYFFKTSQINKFHTAGGAGLVLLLKPCRLRWPVRGTMWHRNLSVFLFPTKDLTLKSHHHFTPAFLLFFLTIFYADPYPQWTDSSHGANLCLRNRALLDCWLHKKWLSMHFFVFLLFFGACRSS